MCAGSLRKTILSTATLPKNEIAGMSKYERKEEDHSEKGENQ